MNASTSPSGQVVSAPIHQHTRWVQDAWPYVQSEPPGVNGRTHLKIAGMCVTCNAACTHMQSANPSMCGGIIHKHMRECYGKLQRKTITVHLSLKIETTSHWSLLRSMHDYECIYVYGDIIDQ